MQPTFCDRFDECRSRCIVVFGICGTVRDCEKICVIGAELPLRGGMNNGHT